MRRCPFENQIDDYLFNRLSEDEHTRFEEHYFDCTQCFQVLAERNEMISVIKEEGPQLIKDLHASKDSRRSSWMDNLIFYLTPKKWALAAVSAAAVLVVVLAVLPRLSRSPHQFFVNDDLVRGESITLISPVINIKSVPAQFSWKSSGEGSEYKIYIYNHELLWTATTNETSIILPDEVRQKMEVGTTYSWQVKAFSPEGRLIAVSSRVQFRIQ
jgi:predicted anti-sigma-YlaC factor YlaD